MPTLLKQFIITFMLKDKIFIFLPPIILISLGLMLFVSSGHDDSFITYWSVHSLVNHGAILNYNGEYIEQSSSLLHVLILSIAYGLTGINIVILGKLSSILAGAWCVIAIYQLAATINQKIALPSALLTATSTYIIYWSYGGLETTIATLIVIWLIQICGDYLHNNRDTAWWKIIAITFAFLLVRPEMPIVFACVMLATAIFTYFKMDYSRYLKKIGILIAIGVITTFIIMTFRLIYFDSIFPQPVYAKRGGGSFFKPFSMEDVMFLRKVFLSDGLEVFIFWMKHIIPTTKWQHSYGYLILLFPNFYMGVFMLGSLRYALWVEEKGKSLNFYMLFSVFFILAYIAFNFLISGDWMEGGRFLVPMLPILLMCLPYALHQWVSNRWIFYGIICIFVLMQIYHLIQFTKHDSLGVPAWSHLRAIVKIAGYHEDFGYTQFEYYNRNHARDIPTIYHLNKIVNTIKTHKKDKVVIMSGQMGMIPFYITRNHFGQVFFVDTNNLVTRNLTHCSLNTESYSMFQLNLSYKYYFEHAKIFEEECHIPKPDIIFDVDWGMSIRDGIVLYLLEEKKKYFHDNFPNYTLVYLQTGDMAIDSEWLLDNNFKANQYILVSNDWLKYFDISNLGYVDFNDIQ